MGDGEVQMRCEMRDAGCVQASGGPADVRCAGGALGSEQDGRMVRPLGESSRMERGDVEAGRQGEGKAESL